MSFNPASLIRAHIQTMPAYEPIHPFEVLSVELGLPVGQIIKLDANENPYGPLPAVREALGRLEYPHIYPDPESTALRNALAEFHRISVNNILASAGADELIDLLMRLLIEPGDVLINCPPTFGMYSFDADVNRARVIDVPRRSDFSLDVTAIERAVAQSHPKLLFLASPNNPDGSLLARQHLEELLELPVVLVLDEAYVEFAPPGSSALGEVLGHENLVVLRTFSKWAALAGLRIGYGAFPDSLIPYLWKIKQPYNVSAAASTAAIVSLEHWDEMEEFARKLVEERERLFTALQSIPWIRPYPSHSNFILCQVVGPVASQVKAELARSGILVRYFNKPGLDDHIRISVGRPEHSDALLNKLQSMEENK
jgi:histidinol-phosphate aminotransferase